MREQEKFQEGVESGEKSGFQKGEKQGFQKGEKQGFQKGERQGEKIGEKKEAGRITALSTRLKGDGRIDDIVRMSTDTEYREKLYEEYGLK